MPFMIGREPIRRTMKYLQAGKLVFKDALQVFTINYNKSGDHHTGIKEFLFWDFPHVQYKNPHVQIVLFKNMTPTPFIRCVYENGKQMLIDVDGKSRDEIMEHLIKVVGKSKEQLEKEESNSISRQNPANIGNGCSKHCLCEVPGQLPCPFIVPLPHHMRGKYKFGMADLPT